MRKKLQSEKGSILMLVIIIFSVVMILGTGLMTVAAQSHSQAVRTADSQQAYYVAKKVLDTFLEDLLDDKKGQAQKEWLDKLFSGSKTEITSEVVVVKDSSEYPQEWECKLKITKKPKPTSLTQTDYYLISTAQKKSDTSIKREIKAVITTDENSLLGGSEKAIIEIGNSVNISSDYGTSIDELYCKSVSINAEEYINVGLVDANGQMNLSTNSGDVTVGELLKASGSIFVTSNGKIDTHTVNAGSELKFTAQSGIKATNLRANGTIELISENDIVIEEAGSTNSGITIKSLDPGNNRINVKAKKLQGNALIQILNARDVQVEDEIRTNNGIIIGANNNVVLGKLIAKDPIKLQGASKLKCESMESASSILIDVNLENMQDIELNKLKAESVSLTITSKGGFDIEPINQIAIEAGVLNIYVNDEKMLIQIRNLIDESNSTIRGNKYTIHYPGGNTEVACKGNEKLINKFSLESDEVNLKNKLYLEEYISNASMISRADEKNIIPLKSYNIKACYITKCKYCTDVTECLQLEIVEYYTPPDKVLPIYHIKSGITNIIQYSGGKFYFGKDKEGREVGIKFYNDEDSEEVRLSKKPVFNIIFEEKVQEISFIDNHYITYTGEYRAIDPVMISKNSKELQFGGSSEGEYTKFIRYEE